MWHHTDNPESTRSYGMVRRLTITFAGPPVNLPQTSPDSTCHGFMYTSDLLGLCKKLISIDLSLARQDYIYNMFGLDGIPDRVHFGSPVQRRS